MAFRMSSQEERLNIDCLYSLCITYEDVNHNIYTNCNPSMGVCFLYWHFSKIATLQVKLSTFQQREGIWYFVSDVFDHIRLIFAVLWQLWLRFSTRSRPFFRADISFHKRQNIINICRGVDLSASNLYFLVFAICRNKLPALEQH